MAIRPHYISLVISSQVMNPDFFVARAAGKTFKIVGRIDGTSSLVT